MRVYDPTLGRFLSRDPLNRAPLFVSDNPYVYAGNDPVSNIDPSGQYRAAGFGSSERESGQATNQQMARVVTTAGTPTTAGAGSCGGCSAVAVPTQPHLAPQPTTAHVTASPQSFWDWGYFVEAVVRAGAAVFLIAAAISSWEVDPLASVALFVNGIDQAIHAAALIARITAGPQSGAYNVLSALGIAFDYVATLADLVALGPAAAGSEITAPLLGNVKALSAIATLLGVDIVADVEDFKALMDSYKP